MLVVPEISEKNDAMPAPVVPDLTIRRMRKPTDHDQPQVVRHDRDYPQIRPRTLFTLT
jgi:hypothetical protein